MVYEFEIIEGGIKLGLEELNIDLRYGVSPVDFMNFYENLTDNYGLRVNEVNFDEIMGEGSQKRTIRTMAIYEYSLFIMYSNVLEGLGVDIQNLVRQIKPCKDYREVRHARGLAEIGYVYIKQGFDIDFLHGSGPDLMVDSFKADLKVVQPYLLSEYQRRPKVSGDAVVLPYEILYEITQSIKSRLEEVLDKVDVLFYDLSGSRFFSTLDLLVEGFSRVVPPQNHRLIFYSRYYYHPSLTVHKSTKEGISSFTSVFPDIFSFTSFYIDFEPILWSSIAGVQDLLSKKI